MTDKKLKPCPFCGGKAMLDRHDIFCEYCGATIKIPTYSENNEWGYPDYKEARREMIAAWNTRTNKITVGNGEDYKVVQG